MIYKRRKKKDSDNLASMLQQFDKELDLQSTASQYSWNSLTPYLVFFASLLVMMLSFSLAKKDYIYCAGFFMISIVMTLFYFYSLWDTHDFISLTTLVAHFFASLPVYLAGFPNIPGIKYIYSPFVSLPVGNGFFLNISLPSIVYLLIPLLLLRMAMKDSWTGAYKIVIPHLVCYFWLSVSTIVFPYTTWFDIVRAGIVYAFLPMLAPILTVFGSLFLLYKIILTNVFGKIAITTILLSVPLLLSKSELFLGKKVILSPTIMKVKKFIMIAFPVLAIVPLLFINISLPSSPPEVDIDWADYKELCVPKDGEMTAPYQRRCHPFLGMGAHWSGSVEQVQISKVENDIESSLNALPGFLSTPIRCFFGKPIPDCEEETMTKKELRKCQIMQSSSRYCHLEDFDQLSFSVTIKVDDISVHLNAGSGFKSKLMALSPGDAVDFSGVFKDVGSPSPLLSLKSLNCSSRVLPEMKELVTLDEDGIFKLLQEALAVTVHFFLFPIVSYTPE